MNTKIHRINLGMVNCYLIKGEKWIMIDTGVRGQMTRIKRLIQRKGISLKDIGLVIITHAHMDHAGNARKIKEATGVNIAIHHLEQEWLETGLAPVPPGRTWLGKLVSTIGQHSPPVTVDPVSADIIIGDEGFPMHDYGISGEIIHTPGHTRGSVCLCLESGEAFVGDLAMSARFMRFTPGLSIFAEDEEELKRSLEKLLKMGIKTVYPAHGRPFPANVF